MSKKLGLFFAALVSAAALSGCAGAKEDKTANSDDSLQNGNKNMDETEASPENEDVELAVWGAEEDEELLRQIIENFQEEYKGQANFNITDRKSVV